MKTNKATWSKIFADVWLLLEFMPDDSVASAVKSAAHYFRTGEKSELSDSAAELVFSKLSFEIDRAEARTAKQSEAGRTAVNRRWKNTNRIENEYDSNTNRISNAYETDTEDIEDSDDSDDIEVSEERDEHKRSPYGIYNNVLLSDTEYDELHREFPDLDQRIDRLSKYMKAKGKKYDDHAATIRLWADRDANATKQKKDDRDPKYGQERVYDDPTCGVEDYGDLLMQIEEKGRKA